MAYYFLTFSSLLTSSFSFQNRSLFLYFGWHHVIPLLCAFTSMFSLPGSMSHTETPRQLKYIFCPQGSDKVMESPHILPGLPIWSHFPLSLPACTIPVTLTNHTFSTTRNTLCIWTIQWTQPSFQWKPVQLWTLVHHLTQAEGCAPLAKTTFRSVSTLLIASFKS